MVKNFLQLLPKDYITPPLTEEAGRKEGEFFSKMSFIVNLFGTGIRYWVCDLPFEEYLEMLAIKEKHNVEWEELLFDFDFLKHFGYNHWSEMSSQKEHTGFLLTTENRIEIKQKSKFIARFKAFELLNQETLFPLYKTIAKTFKSNSEVNLKRIIIVQFEKGLIGKYVIESDEFVMDELQFEVTEFNNLKFVSGMKFQSKKCKSKTEDTVITHVLVLIEE